MKHITTEERYTIQHMLAQGKTNAEIAHILQRSASTIWRERKRNCLQDGDYSATFAERYANQRKQEKPRRSAISSEVEVLLKRGLDQRFSPEQILGRAKLEGHQKLPCVQTIYNHIHRDRKAKGQLYTRLRHRGRKRKPWGHGKLKRSLIVGRCGIEERPAEVEKRTRFGDLECDLIIGAGQSGNILTVNDRSTGLAWMAKLKDKQASTVSAALIELLQPLKGHIHTITSDNGTEFAAHMEVSAALECRYYFARPYHSWERGSNENYNGLVRDYFPKKMKFYQLTDQEIKQVAGFLNERPRKRHKFLSPIEFFSKNYKKIDRDCINNQNSALIFAPHRYHLN